MITVTLQEIRANGPCADGWRKLLSSLPDGAVSCTLAHIVESNGLRDALWALRALPLDDAKRIAVPFARGCADRAKGYAATARAADAAARAARAAYAAADAEYAADAAYAADTVAASAAATASYASDAVAAELATQREHFLALVCAHDAGQAQTTTGESA